MFQKDEYVFYGSGGICRIADIQVSPLSGMPADCPYYVMESVHNSNGTMYIPVDNDQIFLRPLLNREEAEALIERIPSVEAIEEPNAKLLRTKYSDAMKTHDPEEWVRVIKTVHYRTTGASPRVARLSETERSVNESAKRYLYTELSLALGMEFGNVEQYIIDRLGEAE